MNSDTVLLRLVLLAILGASLAGVAHFDFTQYLPVLWLGGGLLIGLFIAKLDEIFGMQLYQSFEGVPMTRSSLFAVILVALSVFVITSSGSILGAGVISGLWLNLLWGATGQISSLAALHAWWPISAQLPIKDAVVLAWLAVGGWGLMSLLTTVTWR